jgi:membrane-associated phospholipid phosphatase
MAPVALAIAVWLFASRAWRGALAWLSLFGTAAVFVFCTKVAYAGWCVGVQELDFTGVSGHSMNATSVLTVAGYFIGSRTSKAAAVISGLLGYCTGVVVGISRLMLGVHSLSEVVVGCALGGAVALLAIRIIRGHPSLVVAPLVFAFTVLTLVFTLHGERAPSEKLTVKVALYLSGRTTPCVREAHCTR